MTRWPSGLRRQLQVLVHDLGVGSNPTLVISASGWVTSCTSNSCHVKHSSLACHVAKCFFTNAQQDATLTPPVLVTCRLLAIQTGFFRQAVPAMQVWMCMMLDLGSTCCGHVPFPTALLRRPSPSSAGTICSHPQQTCVCKIVAHSGKCVQREFKSRHKWERKRCLQKLPVSIECFLPLLC